MKTEQGEKKRKGRKIWFILGGFLLIIVVVIGVLLGIDSKRRKEAEEQIRIIDENRVSNRVIGIAEEYRLMDLVFDHFEDPALNPSARNVPFIIGYFSSESFGELDMDKMTDILAGIAYYVNYDNKLFHPNGKYAGRTLNVIITSGKDSYSVATVNSETSLRQNGRSIFSKKTPYSDSVNARLEETMRKAEEILGRVDNKHKNTTGVKTKCQGCNGSALEAFFAGQPDYTTGPCTMCDGEGYVYE